MASSHGTDADKASLRDAYRRARRLADPQTLRAADEALARVLLGGALDRHDLVLAYVSRGREVDTHGVVRALLGRGSRVAVPRCAPGATGLEFCVVDSLDGLVPGRFGIPEPAASLPALGAHELVGSACLVPGLVFDAAGGRIGQGGGFYDRFLSLYPGEKLGLARMGQVSSNPLPLEAHDVRMDRLVCETGVWECH